MTDVASGASRRERAHFAVYGMSFSYRHRATRVLDEVSFELASHQICALIGPNGSGKSTLMKLAAGILPFGAPGASGQVWYRGGNLLGQSQAARARQIAYVGADLRVDFPISALEVVTLGRTSSGSGWLPRLSQEDKDLVRWAMTETLCWDLRDRDLQTLSDGERQRVALARGLSQGARVLFLDETLSRMDLNHQALLGRRLRALATEGWTILLVSHDLNLAAEWAHSALILQAGKLLASGPLAGVLTEARVRALYPGADLVLGRNPATGAPKVFFGPGQ